MSKSLLVSGLVCSMTMSCSGAERTPTPNGGVQVGNEPGSAASSPADLVHQEGAKGADCSGYNGFTASLATATVECAGTIDQHSFSIDANGFLARNFDTCLANIAKLESIDSLLSLQYRGERLPLAKECIAGRWANWKAEFDRSGATACPSWRKESVIGAPTAERIDSFLRDTVRAGDLEQPRVLTEQREDHVYSVAFPGPADEAGYNAPGERAALCAGGFAGFVLETYAETVLTDPPYWLLDNTYSSSAEDPFLQRGYRHLMSYYGPLPGTQFANRFRAKPCPTCPPESCTYYTGIHVVLPLKLDCLNPADFSTCVGYCAP